MDDIVPPIGFGFAGTGFTLEAVQNGTLQDDFVFLVPVTVEMHYTEAEILGVDESSLTLDYWDGAAWVDAACGPYESYLDEN